jgi:hypothetical protein
MFHQFRKKKDRLKNVLVTALFHGVLFLISVCYRMPSQKLEEDLVKPVFRMGIIPLE